MNRYLPMIKKLADTLKAIDSKVLNVYDIDGTLACYMRGSKCVEMADDIPNLARKPADPYILLSARSTDNIRKTNLWCTHYTLKPLEIFHRYTDTWSFERGNISDYKPDMLETLRRELSGISFVVYDDDEISMQNTFDGISFVTLSRI